MRNNQQSKKEYAKRCAQELTDTYILTNLGFPSGYTSYSPMPPALAELVEKKREYILTYRVLKQLNNLINELRNKNVTAN